MCCVPFQIWKRNIGIPHVRNAAETNRHTRGASGPVDHPIGQMLGSRQYRTLLSVTGSDQGSTLKCPLHVPSGNLPLHVVGDSSLLFYGAYNYNVPQTRGATVTQQKVSLGAALDIFEAPGTDNLKVTAISGGGLKDLFRSSRRRSL